MPVLSADTAIEERSWMGLAYRRVSYICVATLLVPCLRTFSSLLGQAGAEYPYPTNIFTHCRVAFPAARVSIMGAKVAICLHLLAFQWTFGSKEGAQHREEQTPIATQWH